MMRRMNVDLEERVRLLERRSLRQSRALLATTCAAVAILLAAAKDAPRDPAGPDLVTAKAFQLVGGKDTVLGHFAIDRHGHPELELRDRAGKPRIRLRIDRGREPIVSVHDDKGTPRATLAVDEVGNPHVILSDKGRKPRWHAAVSPRGAPSLVFVHVDGRMPAGIGIHADGKPWILGASTKQEDGKGR